MALHAGICTAFTFKVLESLKKGGITTVVDFISRNPEELSQNLMIPYKDVCSIRRVLLAENSPLPISGTRLYESALTLFAILPTGFKRINQLLDGGLYSGELTEIAGDSATGKTRLCLRSMAATVSAGSQKAIFIDTSGSFDCQSLVEGIMCSHKDKNTMTESELKPILERVTHIQALNINELMVALNSLHSLLTRQSPDVQCLKMVVVDNLASVINPLIGGDSVYRQGTLAQIGTQLKQLAVTHGVAVLVTNNMTASFKGSKAKPSLGKVWSHMAHSRIILSRPEHTSLVGKGMRMAELNKSGRQATPDSCLFSLDYFATDPPD